MKKKLEPVRVHYETVKNGSRLETTISFSAQSFDRGPKISITIDIDVADPLYQKFVGMIRDEQGLTIEFPDLRIEV